ncbi:tyrosine--tRNA ligase [Mycoplasma sp. Z386]
MKKKLVDDLKKRGILKDITNEEKFINMKDDEFIYAGFDPTAISLHLGNYIQICTLLRFQKAGVKVLAVVGGATGMIGDPSFRSSDRVLLSDDEVKKNKESIINQLKKFNLEVFDNLEIYQNMNILTFLSTVGKYLNINYMISKDSVADRLENGLSFTEFSYQLIQGWDFKYLYENYNVKGQLGGSDQWGNITTGIEVIRKAFGDNNNAFGITTNLLTDKNNKKFGKSTGGGSLWLKPELTSAYSLYQFLLASDDLEVEKFLKWLTFLSLEQLEEVIQKHNENKSFKLAQKTLAFEVVKNIHSETEANNAVKITNILFNKGDFKELTIEHINQLRNSIPFFLQTKDKTISDLLIETKIFNSKREMREFIAQGALIFNDKKIMSEDENIDFSLFDGKFILIKKGKKHYFVIEFN